MFSSENKGLRLTMAGQYNKKNFLVIIPNENVCGAPFWVSYNCQLKGFFFLEFDCLFQGNARVISTNCPGLVALIGSYLDRID